jgi:hypothetical protein
MNLSISHYFIKIVSINLNSDSPMTKQLLPDLLGGKNLNRKIKLVRLHLFSIEVQMITKDFIYRFRLYTVFYMS